MSPVSIICPNPVTPATSSSRRTRWSDPVLLPPCAHHWQSDRIFPALNGQDRKAGMRSGIVGVYGNGGDKRADLWEREMGIDWMSRAELTQAIPPAFTEAIGAALLRAVEEPAA
jgi:hypothetical protein